MGYLCPVCGEAEVDAEHVANHMAFTAILHSGDHETWLDEKAPEWTDMSPETLGPIVAEHAEEVELDIPDDEEFSPEERHVAPGQQIDFDRGQLSGHDRQILEEARELTRQMLESSGESAPEDEE